jgi:serine/threonine protein phosphatase PrpC
MFEVAYTQHRGKLNPHQQDALWNGSEAFQEIDLPCRTHTLDDPSLLLAIADGVSVSPEPQLASLFAIKALTQDGDTNRPLTARRIRDLHERLSDRYARGRTRGSSTTLVAARWTGDSCEIVNVGDSRAYRISANGEWLQLSHDHTILNDMLAAGEAEPGREYASLYQGLAHCLVADHDENEFAVHCRQFPLLPGDHLLLCSDGLHDTLGDKLRSLYDPAMTPLEQLTRWRKAVLSAGAPDNFSAVFARRALS